MAEETDAARDRVLAARATMGAELATMEASVRAALDIPAKIKRSPAKAAAIAGSAAFLVVGGPKRVFQAGKRALTGEPAPLPESMLPDEIEKTLKKLGTDGQKLRGTLERDFADYVKRASKDRAGLQKSIAMMAAKPLLSGGAKAASSWLFRNDEEGFQDRLAQVRERMQRRTSEMDRSDPAEDRPAAD